MATNIIKHASLLSSAKSIAERPRANGPSSAHYSNGSILHLPTVLPTMNDSPEKLARMQTVIHELRNQSDRGAAIVGAAWIEEALLSTLRAVLKLQPKAWQRMFNGYGPLNTFAAKIDLLALLGLTTESICEDLHSVRKIRNQLAHAIAHETTDDALSFESDSIKDKCLSLKCVAHEEHSVLRQAFIRACAILHADFEIVQNVSRIPDLGYVFANVERESLG